MWRARRARLGVLLLALVSIVGCSRRQKAPIVHHPDWQYQDYHRVAVLPFKATRPDAVEAARQAEFMLVDLLTGNGAFTVLTRSDLADIMTEQDLSRLADVADPATALPEGMLQVAQAVVLGTITDFDLKREQIERRRPRYAHDRQGRLVRDRSGRPVVVGEDVFVEYRHVARLGGNVRVVDAATGRVLMSHTVPPVEKDDARWNSPPKVSPEELAVDVAKEIATDFYRKIAPQRVEVKLGGDCLVVATEYYEGRYEEQDKLPVTLEEFLLVARKLPRECDRNDFRLAISPKDGREYLVEHEFTWSPSKGARGEAVRVPMATLKESGYEKFTAKLFAAGNEQPILERDFRLVLPKSKD